MRIKKMFQGSIPENKIVGTYTSSNTDVYNCNYVNSIILNLVYPIGSIYMSVNNTNPSTIFGGTWERIQDRFLLGAGNTYNAGSTGGEASVQLQQSQMPTTVPVVRATANGEWSCGIWGNYGGGYGINLPGQNGWGGQGESHNNMPPYLTVYIWKRTA